jgi:hypothetical protein
MDTDKHCKTHCHSERTEESSTNFNCISISFNKFQILSLDKQELGSKVRNANIKAWKMARIIMSWIDYNIFTRKWLERAERGNVAIDDGDRFISLWIAFNGWMKLKFSEDITDRALINNVILHKDFIKAFNQFKRKDKTFHDNLKEFKAYRVVDMRDIDNKKKIKKYNGTFKSLIETIYQIRCNLFHGRKDISADDTDYKLVCLAYKILLPYFKYYYQNYRF